MKTLLTTDGLSEDRQDAIIEVANLFADIQGYMDKMFMDSREKSLVKTKLDEGLMWAHRAIFNGTHRG